MQSLLRILLVYLLHTQARSEVVSPFSQTNVAVLFDPFVKDKEVEAAYNVRQLIPMITKISSTFGKIMISKIHSNSGFTYQLIPTAVATYNLKYRNPNHQAIEILLPFGMTVLKNGASTNFDIAKRLADEANKIYPGTVKWMYLLYDDLSDDTVEDAKNYLLYIKSRLSGTEYMLGALFPLGYCGTDMFRLPTYLLGILPLVTEVIFAYSPVELLLLGEPRVASNYITESFKLCMKKVNNYNRSISLQLYTAWKFTNKTSVVTHDQKLVNYWLEINEWVVESNVSVVFDSAFNNPFKSMEWANTGWWKLIENSSYRDSSQYVYEEKMNPIKPATEMSLETTSATQMWPIAVAMTLLVFVILVVSGFLWKPLRCKLGKYCLTKEVNEFYADTTQIPDRQLLRPNSKIRQTAFNRELELSKSEFTVEINSHLGSGTFGAVYEGTVTRANSNEAIKVAVKRTINSSPSTTRTSLLCEIKVMSHLGKHENLVNIIGAYTKGIRKGKVYIFLELCELGSLEKHLREKMSLPQEEFDIDQNIPVAVESCYTDLTRDVNAEEELVEVPSEHRHTKCTTDRIAPNASDLHRWAFEIANGMEFLASKNVVHADLATRNVLLTLDKRAKISDFGLSRRLYDYQLYVKTQQEPLPWRWMAPESLRRMEFNEKTDVWAFGVTLWEIYSLGDLPFEGISWTPNFSSQLAQGLRLQEPRFRVNGMYSHMLKCWIMDSTKRPTFSELKSMLQDSQESQLNNLS